MSVAEEGEGKERMINKTEGEKREGPHQRTRAYVYVCVCMCVCVCVYVQINTPRALAIPEVDIVGVKIVMHECALLAEELHALVVAIGGAAADVNIDIATVLEGELCVCVCVCV